MATANYPSKKQLVENMGAMIVKSDARLSHCIYDEKNDAARFHLENGECFEVSFGGSNDYAHIMLPAVREFLHPGSSLEDDPDFF